MKNLDLVYARRQNNTLFIMFMLGFDIIYKSNILPKAKTKGSTCLHYKYADIAFCLCRAA